jgi:hypothetical protein
LFGRELLSCSNLNNSCSSMDIAVAVLLSACLVTYFLLRYRMPRLAGWITTNPEVETDSRASIDGIFSTEEFPRMFR